MGALTDRGAQLWYVSLFFFVFVSFHVEGAVQVFAERMRAALSGATI